MPVLQTMCSSQDPARGNEAPSAELLPYIHGSHVGMGPRKCHHASHHTTALGDGLGKALATDGSQISAGPGNAGPILDPLLVFQTSFYWGFYCPCCLGNWGRESRSHLVMGSDSHCPFLPARTICLTCSGGTAVGDIAEFPADLLFSQHITPRLVVIIRVSA